jgi:hypothetical protein
MNEITGEFTVTLENVSGRIGAYEQPDGKLDMMVRVNNEWQWIEGMEGPGENARECLPGEPLSATATHSTPFTGVRLRTPTWGTGGSGCVLTLRPTSSTLVVELVKIVNLADEDKIGKSDPYVIFKLQKDGWLHDSTLAEAKSSKKKDEQNPVYNEQFLFTHPDLTDTLLQMNVKDDDTFKDESLGEYTIKLDEQELEPGVPKEVVVKVDDNWFSKDAEATLVLTWTG